MTLVYVAKNWTWPDLLRQTPGEQGYWSDVHFTLDPVETCDYVIILNQVRESFSIQCSPEHVWTIMQEPPNEYFRYMHRGPASSYRVYTQDENLQGKRYIHSQPALPWHVNKTYDHLVNCGVPDKPGKLSWITSNIAVFEGHRLRMRFLEQINGKIEFDLYGRGFNYIEDKWDGLAPYRYSIVAENIQNPYYWSEKIADCFLAWTMPIYFGCTRIDEFFPAEAMVRIDLNDPATMGRIRETLSSNLWQERLDAIAHARNLVLNYHQLFPFLVRKINEYENLGIHQEDSKAITISNKLRLVDSMRVNVQRLNRRFRTLICSLIPKCSALKQ